MKPCQNDGNRFSRGLWAERESKTAKRRGPWPLGIFSGYSSDLVDVKRGKYFRIVATVLADGVDVAAALVKNGLGRLYGGGKREGWCK